MARVARFLEGVNKIMESIRASTREISEDLGMRFDDPLADVRILAGDDCQNSEFSNAKVAITFDGAGYDLLSYNADLEWAAELESAAQEFGFDATKARLADSKTPTTRDKLEALAESCGLHMEDYASWAVTFYPK